MLKKTIILLLLSLTTISCEKPEPQEKTYTIVLNKEEYEKNGFLPTGINPETHLVEVIELKNHPFYIGVQYHPEYKSTVATPHPLFCAFIKATTKD